MMRQMFVAVAMLSSAAGLHAQTAAPPPDSVSGAPRIDSTTQTEDVKFKNEQYDRMTVPVRLSGSGPFRFLVDTGADRTSVSREIAGQLGLVQGASALVHTISGVSTVSTADVPALQLTKSPVNIKDAAVLESANMGADGIVGVDALRSQSVLFDFENNILSIVPSSVAELRDDPNVIVVTAARKNGRLVVSNAEANGHDVTVVIDTGAQVSIGNEALRRELIGRGLIDPSQKVQLQSVTGDSIPGDYMFVRELQMGGVTLQNLAIIFADAHSFKEMKLDRRPALLLGMNAIRAFKKVSIDFAKRKFRVVLPESSQLEVRMANIRLR